MNTYQRKIAGLFLLLSCLFTSSCEKALDTKNNYRQGLSETATGCQAILDNYAVMNTGYPSDGEVSADDYYVIDASYLQANISETEKSLYVWAANAIRPKADPQWQSPYYVVYNANLVLESLEKLKSTTAQTTLDGIRGQALFFRAYAFWHLAQLYAKPYASSTANTDLGIPLYFSSDVNGSYSKKSTMQETYNRITQDLQEALALLPNTATTPARPSKTAAYAMLARVYLSMEDYTSALNNANAALLLKSTLLTFTSLNTTSATPFTRYNTEVIFHSLMVPVQILNPGTAGNNTAKINLSIVNSYAINDLRKTIFLKQNTGPELGTYRFSGNYEPSVSSTLFNGLAVDEMYLIRAECYARTGNATLAMTDLNTLLRTRFSGTYVNLTAATPAEALGIILTERRKELLMRGQRWTDLRRLNKDTNYARTLSRTINGITYTLPPNDLRYTLLIPDEVIIKSNGIVQQNNR